MNPIWRQLSALCRFDLNVRSEREDCRTLFESRDDEHCRPPSMRVRERALESESSSSVNSSGVVVALSTSSPRGRGVISLREQTLQDFDDVGRITPLLLRVEKIVPLAFYHFI